jgi:hypothetical protein
MGLTLPPSISESLLRLSGNKKRHPSALATDDDDGPLLVDRMLRYVLTSLRATTAVATQSPSNSTTIANDDSEPDLSLQILERYKEWRGDYPSPHATLCALKSAIEWDNKNSGGDGLSNVLQLVDSYLAERLGDESKEEEAREVLAGAISLFHRYGEVNHSAALYHKGVELKIFPPMPILEPSEGRVLVLDLHGLNVGMANAVLRRRFGEILAAAVRDISKRKDETSSSNVTYDYPHALKIITGRGLHSARTLGAPVLRGEVLRLLVEEFYPPFECIGTEQQPNASTGYNLGRLVVSRESINEWIKVNYLRRNEFLLGVAELLKGRIVVDYRGVN